MTTPAFLLRGVVSKLLSSVTAMVEDASQEASMRMHRYGALVADGTSQTRHGLNDEGSYLAYVTTNTGTGMSVPATAAYAATNPLIYIYNPESFGGKSLFLDYFKIVTEQAAAGTTAQYAIVLDSVARAFGTDNTLLVTPLNPGFLAPGSVPIVKVQNSTTASAASALSANAKIAARGGLSAPSGAQGTFRVSSGASDVGVGAVGASSTSAGISSDTCAPIAIPPGYSCSIYFWRASPGTTVVEYELGMWAR